MNNVPFDPDETHGGEHNEEQLDQNSMTWGTVDPDFDEVFRERLGPLPIMPTPPYAFERVLVSGRRRRARKVWAGAAAAAFVVMAGTAGTTVVLHGNSANGPVIGPAGTSTSPATTAAASHTPSASPTPSASAGTAIGGVTATATPSASAATATATPSSTTPECVSTTFTMSVSTQTGSSGTAKLIIVLTNTSGNACTTYGYPGLDLETQSGQFESTTVVREDKSSVQQLTVEANESISTTATYTASTAGSTESADCEAPTYYLALIPPNEKTQIVQTISGGPITVCGSGDLDTTPFVMGTTGS